jgi:hypothetical protein
MLAELEILTWQERHDNLSGIDCEYIGMEKTDKSEMEKPNI